jgi:hypothetical protein
MTQSILVFDFGANEEAAQQARHRVEAWKQGFRLGNKMLLKFEREETPEKAQPTEETAQAHIEPNAAAQKSGKKKSSGKAGTKESAKAIAEPQNKEPPVAANANVRLLVRLDFSEHEKLSHQRWLDRIPAEEPFKSVKGEIIRTGDPEFPKTIELFDSLE